MTLVHEQEIHPAVVQTVHVSELMVVHFLKWVVNIQQSVDDGCDHWNPARE